MGTSKQGNARQIRQLREANAADDREARRLAAELRRNATDLTPAEMQAMARKIATIGDRRERRAEQIADLEGEGA